MSIVSGRWSMPGVEDPPGDSVVGTPERRAGSIRRTSHLTATFPAGPAAPGTWGTQTTLVGGVRDVLTARCGAPRFLARARVRLELDASRQIVAATCVPAHPGVASLIGASAGRGFRTAARAVLPDEDAALYAVLDDVSVVSGICGVAWSQHKAFEIPVDDVTQERASFQRTSTGRVACSGLRPGGYHEQSWRRGIGFPHWVQPAGDLTNPSDPWAWHEIEPPQDACFRRRRRLDVWREGDVILLDAHYRDSIYARGPFEVALHEYVVRAAVDDTSYVIQQIVAEGKVLPFPECPWATPHVAKLIGMPIASLRTAAPETLTELEGCSHLNDMLRGFADAPELVRALDA